ncbi:MAG: hypothetical protein WBK19_11010 [Azonexus sp.]
MSLDTQMIERLRTVIFDKTRLKIAADDPIFEIVALNNEVLNDGIARLVEQLDRSTAEFNKHAATCTKQKKIEIHEAAINAVRSILTVELSNLNKSIIRATEQLSSNRSETHKWVISVATIASLIGGLVALVVDKFPHLI